jgi:hypothetical protein
MVGRNLEIDGNLSERAMRAKTLQPIHPRIALEIGDP